MKSKLPCGCQGNHVRIQNLADELKKIERGIEKHKMYFIYLVECVDKLDLPQDQLDTKRRKIQESCQMLINGTLNVAQFLPIMKIELQVSIPQNMHEKLTSSLQQYKDLKIHAQNLIAQMKAAKNTHKQLSPKLKQIQPHKWKTLLAVAAKAATAPAKPPATAAAKAAAATAVKAAAEVKKAAVKEIEKAAVAKAEASKAAVAKAAAAAVAKAAAAAAVAETVADAAEAAAAAASKSAAAAAAVLF